LFAELGQNYVYFVNVTVVITIGGLITDINIWKIWELNFIPVISGKKNNTETWILIIKAHIANQKCLLMSVYTFSL